MIKVIEVIGKRPKGGVGSLMVNYQSYIDGNKIQMDYLIFDDNLDGDFDRKVKSMGATVYVLPELKNIRLFKIWNSINTFFCTFGKIYDVVHLHSPNIAFMVFSAAKKNGINNLLLHSHATVYSDKILNAIRNYFLCIAIKKYTTHYWACSIAAGMFLFGKDFMHSRRHWVMHNAIEVKRFIFNKNLRNKTRQEFGYTDEIVLGTVGRLAPQKNQTFLLDIMKSLVERGQTKYRILIVGDGELRENLTEKAKRLGVDEYVMLAGTRTDIPELLWAMDIFLLPSHYEGLPVSGVEAQAAGLPCIFSNQITEEAGIVNATFLPIDQEPDIWCSKIMDIKMHEINRKEAVYKMITAGYDIETEASCLVKHYTELVNGNNT